jgi:hypothetical protein
MAEIARLQIDPIDDKARVWQMLARFHDEGVDPSIAMLAGRAKRHPMAVDWKLRSLVRDGHLEVLEEGAVVRPGVRSRTRYRIPAAPKPAATAASTKEAQMATKPKDADAEKLAPTPAPAAQPVLIDGRRLPPFARHGAWLPDAFEEVDWAPLEEIRDRHTAALTDLEGARSTGDLESERGALLALADLAEAAVRTVTQGESVLLAAYDSAAADLMPKTKPRHSAAEPVNLQLAGGHADDPEGAETERKIGAELAESKPRREAFDRDDARVRKLLGLIRKDALPQGGLPITRLAAQAAQLRSELPSAPIAPPGPSLEERVAALEASG